MCHGLSPSFLTQSAVCVQHTGGSQVLGVYVGLVVLRQMVAPHEAFLTLAALKALVSCEEKHGEEKSVGVLKKKKRLRLLVPSRRPTCVRPGVSLKLVAACESFAAENPAADKGPLARVQPYVRSEKRRFPEGLLTSGDVADVFPLPHFPGPVARDKCAVLQFTETCTSRRAHVSHSPLVCVFTVGTRARHTPLLLPWLAGQLQREGLVYLQGGLACCRCQLQPRSLHGLHRQMLLA